MSYFKENGYVYIELNKVYTFGANAVDTGVSVVKKLATLTGVDKIFEGLGNFEALKPKEKDTIIEIDGTKWLRLTIEEFQKRLSLIGFGKIVQMGPKEFTENGIVNIINSLIVILTRDHNIEEKEALAMTLHSYDSIKGTSEMMPGELADKKLDELAQNVINKYKREVSGNNTLTRA